MFGKKVKEYKLREDLTKNIYIDFNAWVFNGSALLWASLLEEIWKGVKNEFGRYRVRKHRFSIKLSNELASDIDTTKQKKRQVAFLIYKVKVFFYVLLVIACAILLF